MFMIHVLQGDNPAYLGTRFIWDPNTRFWRFSLRDHLQFLSPFFHFLIDHHLGPDIRYHAQGFDIGDELGGLLSLAIHRGEGVIVLLSVYPDYQGKGLGKLFIRKLARAARENGISGLVAYTSPQNKAMIALFKTLPYKVKTSFDGDSLMLTCRFDELAETPH